MEPRKKYLKLVVFVPAIVLVGGFVGYRAGAFQTFSKPEPQPEPQPAAVTEQPPAPQPAPESGPAYMGGSKTLILAPYVPGTSSPGEPGAATPPQPTADIPPAILYGSKSAPIFTLPTNPGAQLGPSAIPPNPPKQPLP